MAPDNNLDMRLFNDDDVLAFRDGTVKLIKLKRALDVALSSKVPDALADALSTQKLRMEANRQFRTSGAWTQRDGSWFREGIDCEILQLGANSWKRGKIRLRVVVEFIPDNELLLAEPAVLEDRLSHELGNGKNGSLLNQLL